MTATLIIPLCSPSLFLWRGRERPGVLRGGEQRGRATNAIVRNVALGVHFTRKFRLERPSLGTTSEQAADAARLGLDDLHQTSIKLKEAARESF